MFDVWLVYHAAAAVLEEALAEVRFSADEFGLCTLIYYYGPLTPGQVARWTGIAPTTTSTMIKRLMSRGLLEQAVNPEDGRSRLVSLSSDGQKAEEQSLEILAGVLEQLQDRLAEHSLVRVGLEDLDGALRGLANLDERPYQYSSSDHEAAGSGPNTDMALSYGGDPLTAQERSEVRRYIDWVRDRRASTTQSVNDK